MVEFWIDERKRRIEDKKNWAEIKVKLDKEIGEEYIDVVAGTKNKDPHIHIGFNLNQSLKFSEFRDITKSMGRKVESKKFGLLQDDTVNIKSDIEPVRTITIQFSLIEETREVTIDKFEFISD